MNAAQALGRWLPPVALMAVIYVLSDQPHLDSGLGLIDLIARKLAHMAEYALLAFLWWRALGLHLAPAVALATAWALAAIYAISDEYHQTFVPGRTGAATDVLLDALGAAIAVALIARRGRAG